MRALLPLPRRSASCVKTRMAANSVTHAAVQSAMQGASLLVALVVLIMMSMGALAMVRAVGAGLLIAGNFAFRQAAVLASERGSEAAIDWLSARFDSADLLTDQPAAGYYAHQMPDLDLTGGADGATAQVDWAGDHCAPRTVRACVQASAAIPADSAGQVVRFLIQRLCRSSGSPESATNSCYQHRSTLGGSPNHGQLSYGASRHFQPVSAVYYRITVQVRGPRGTTAFTQTLVHF